MAAPHVVFATRNPADWTAGTRQWTVAGRTGTPFPPKVHGEGGRGATGSIGVVAG